MEESDAVKAGREIGEEKLEHADSDDVSSSDGCFVPEDDKNGPSTFDKDLAKKETRKIRVLRVVVIFLVVATGAILSALLFYFINREQEQSIIAKVRRDGFVVVNSTNI